MTQTEGKPTAGSGGNKYLPYEQRTGGEALVYFTRNLSAEGLIKAYEQVNEHMQDVWASSSIRASSTAPTSFRESG